MNANNSTPAAPVSPEGGRDDVTTIEAARRLVPAWFAERGIAAPGLVMDNGSGLSRSERITPRQLALMLQAAYQGKWSSDLVMSIPVVGVDGTMRNRMKTGAAAACSLHRSTCTSPRARSCSRTSSY